MIAALIVVALFALLVRVFVIPVLREERARQRQTDAAEERANAPFWDGLAKQPPLFGHLDDAPEEYGTQANAVAAAQVEVDTNVRSIAAERARRATHVSQLPHGSARRGTHL